MRKTFYAAASVIAVALAVELAAAFQVPIKPVVFANLYTNKCLQRVNGSTAQDAAIVQTGCNGGNNGSPKSVAIFRTFSAAFAWMPGVRPLRERQYCSGRVTESATRTGKPR
jgi:hypothetical protein